MLAVGDLVRIRNLTASPSYPWARNGLGGDVVALCTLRGQRRQPLYAVRIGEYIMVAGVRYFELVLPGAGGREIVEWNWRDLMMGVW